MATKTKAVAVRKTTAKGRPTNEKIIADLKAKLQFHMCQSAMRYIALQQTNRGITRLHKHIDRLKREAQDKEAMYTQVARASQRILGACMRGEVKPGAPIKVVGPGAQDFVESLVANMGRMPAVPRLSISDLIDRTTKELSGKI